MTYTIEIAGIELRAAHGCYDVEQAVGGNYRVDVVLQVEGIIENDELDGTVNYVEVYEVVKAEMALPSRIIEHAAWRISQAIRAKFPRITAAKVTLSKLAPPLGGKAERVSVTI